VAKLDWSKAKVASPDPARGSKYDTAFQAFGPTPDGRKEYKEAKQTRSAAAKKAAQTRAANKAKQAAQQQEEIEADQRNATFFEKLKAKMALGNERRRQKRMASI